jgi:hypothetical protein
MAAMISFKKDGKVRILSFHTVYQALLFIEIESLEGGTEFFMMCGKYMKQEVNF